MALLTRKAALIRARTKNPQPTTLESELREAGAPAAPDKVAGTLEALASVVPTAITGLYTASVLVLRGVAQTTGETERSTVSAALAKAGRSEEFIKEALAKLPEETRKLVELRWVMVAAAVAAVVISTLIAAKKAKKPNEKGRFPLGEMVAGIVAIMAWTLAAPGTPLAAYHPASDLLALTVTIAGVAALILWATGALVLKKEQQVG